MSKDAVLESNVNADALVPTSWKVCAVLFKHIAERNLSVLDEMLESMRDWQIDNVVSGLLEESILEKRELSLSNFIEHVYRVACKVIGRVLRTEKYNAGVLQEALKKMNNLAEEILDSYDKFLTCLDAEEDYAKIFAHIAENCRIVTSLYNVLDNPNDDGRLNAIYDIVNGSCIKPMGYDLFECAVHYDLLHGIALDESIITQLGILYETEYVYDLKYVEGVEVVETLEFYRYKNVKLLPMEGYGMSLYYFLLLLVAIDSKQYSTWKLKEFIKHIEWPDSYRLVDQWEKNSCYKGHRDISSSVKPTERVKLAQLCGRPTFEDIVASESMRLVIENKTFAGLEFSQYKFLYDNLDDLGKFKKLLIKEMSYLYANLDELSDCFPDYNRLVYFRHLQLEYKKFVDDLYESQSDINLWNISKLLLECEDFCIDSSEYEHKVYSELVKRYIHYCAIQDEALLIAVKGRLEDASIIRSPENRETDTKLRKAIARLQENGIIDAKNNVQLIRENGSHYKLSELVYCLIDSEFVVPKGGWKAFLVKWKKTEVEGRFLEKDGSIKKDKYDYLDYGTILKELNWCPFDKLFVKGGNQLSVEELKTRFSNQKADYIKHLKPKVEKYDLLSKTKPNINF